MIRLNTASRFVPLCLCVVGWACGPGCSQQDFAKPLGGIRSGSVRVVPVPRPAGSDSDARSEKLAAMLSRLSEERGAEAGDYIVGPGDELSISIFALEQPDETTEIRKTITRDGKLSLPWVGDIDVRGKTVRDLEKAIANAYEGRYIKNPQVSVRVVNYRSVAVVVTGAIRNPGVYYLNDNYSTVLEMLAKAGGLTPDAGDEVLVIPGGDSGFAENVASNATEAAELNELSRQALLRGTNALFVVSLKRLIDEGDLTQNIRVGAGGIVSVKSVAEQYVYVLGYVQRPGAFPLRGAQQVDALRAVALAGGLSPTARAENSFLVRETPEGQVVMPVNLTKIARGDAPTVYLQPGDTLVVGSSALARLSEFVRPSIGAGMTYTPMP